MALKNSGGNATYLRIKEGTNEKGGLVYGFTKGGEHDPIYNELEGTITNISYRNEEYEGVPQRKCIFTVEDETDVYKISINVENANYNGLVSFLQNVDVSRKLTLHPKSEKQVKDGKEVTRKTILVSQDGKYAKSYFTKENNHGLPAWDVVKVGAKKVTDKSAFTEFLENFVMTNFVPKLSSGGIKKAAPIVETEPEEETMEKLPWED